MSYVLKLVTKETATGRKSIRHLKTPLDPRFRPAITPVLYRGCGHDFVSCWRCSKAGCSILSTCWENESQWEALDARIKGVWVSHSTWPKYAQVKRTVTQVLPIPPWQWRAMVRFLLMALPPELTQAYYGAPWNDKTRSYWSWYRDNLKDNPSFTALPSDFVILVCEDNFCHLQWVFLRLP